MLRVLRHVGQLAVLRAVLCLGVFSPLVAQAQARFDILEYQVLGNSLLSDLAVEKAVTPYLGERRALSDVDAARGALLQHYQDAGYLSVQVLIPEQKVDGGVVRLQVVEAPVGDVRVQGAVQRAQPHYRRSACGGRGQSAQFCAFANSAGRDQPPG